MLSITSLIETFGYAGIFGVIFAESGLLIGFFLPGDSLLFTAGFLASQGLINIWVLTIGTFIAAVAGDWVGFHFGQRYGKKLFQKEDSTFFKKEHLLSARAFYEKHGKKTIVMSRFIPIVRTFAPIVAGMADMEYMTFLVFNILGAIGWAVGVSLAGYFLGRTIPNVDKYLLPMVLVIAFASLLPTILHVVKDKKQREDLVKLGWRLLKKLGIPSLP